MSESAEEHIVVADVSAGQGGAADDDPGEPVELPVVEVLTGRSFLTGKSGGGKSNTASVIVEQLLDNNYPVFIVDVDGEYYGLKEEYELLHAGADEECDIQVSPEHAEKLATLALEQNVPVILDVSGYLDESVAKDLLRRTARQLFAKEKKLKKPFLLLVEEIHEYIPEGGGLDDTGKMLIKVAKRGRKHGLGIVGISQRPADVKKDYITQCDWLVWHRLTWNNDTKVVGRILGSEYADAVEDLDDGEAFLMTDWGDDVRRVQFRRKRTFDAGATPGLDDFERPELKSVDGDLVSELRAISEERERRESELADLRQELERKEARIEELESELAEARNLERVADSFAQAMLRKADAPYRHSRGTGDDPPPGGPDSADSDGADGRESDDTGDTTDRDSAGVTDGVEATTLDRQEADRERRGRGAGGPPSEDRPWEVSPDDVGGGFGAGRTRPRTGAELRERVADLDERTLGMLAHYGAEGVATPVGAHLAAGGEGDRNRAYALNRRLRTLGVVRHVGRGYYECLLGRGLDGILAEDGGDEAVSVGTTAGEAGLRDSPGASAGLD